MTKETEKVFQVLHALHKGTMHVEKITEGKKSHFEVVINAPTSGGLFAARLPITKEEAGQYALPIVD